VTCREATEFLSDYLADELPSDVRSVFEEHLSICPGCREYLNQFRATLEAGTDAFPAQESDATTRMPEELVRSITAAMVRPKP
jgi:predicted anti-sigma-YlaC factor YlaD